MTRTKVIEIVGDHEGGGTKFAAALVERLDPARFDLTLIAPYAPWLDDLCTSAEATFRPLPLKASRTDRSLRLQLRRILVETRPDVIHAHGTRAAWYISRSLRRREQRALIYHEHLFSCDARRGLLRLPWYALEWYLCHRATYLMTGCRVNARRAVAAHWATPARIPVQHIGVDLEDMRAQLATMLPRRQLGVAEDVLLVGSLGRLIPQKGFEFLLDAAVRVLRECPHTMFLVVGDGVLRTTLEARCRALGIAQHVKFFGAQEQPWRILAHCDVIALPYLYEGLCIAALEASAAERPLVATAVGGIVETVTDGVTGLLVPPAQSAALAEAIVLLLKDPAKRAAMSSVASMNVAEYDMGAVVRNVAAVYEDVSARGATRPRRASPAAQAGMLGAPVSAPIRSHSRDHISGPGGEARDARA